MEEYIWSSLGAPQVYFTYNLLKAYPGHRLETTKIYQWELVPNTWDANELQASW